MLLLGDMSVRSVISVMHFFGAIAAALIGIGFFFAIVGVFGFSAAIAALVVFIALAAVLFRRPQAEGVLR
jgi:uncharacterized membrane protein YuzA (DUF378 family)